MKIMDYLTNVYYRYVGSYIPGGVSTLRYGTAYIGRRAASVLPI
jgi:hypothetical protein